ncbi:MAG: Smr/MutS family protein [Paludibacter sp.]|nr:Smr/MutS family protein [Paludibacter sp.]
MLYPQNIENKIDFTAIRALLNQKCISSLGREEVEKMTFSVDYHYINTLLSQTAEMQQILTSNTDELPLGNFVDIREALARVRIDGLWLDENETFGLLRALESANRIILFFAKNEHSHYLSLKALLPDNATYSLIIKRINAIIDKFGKVKDSASPELAHIRQEINRAASSISRSLNAILRQAKTDGWVEKDVTPAMRDGRLVIPVLPSYKRKIAGIVHDESATGKTVYIEPQQVVEANNRIRELEAEERREIIRILTDFTNFVRPHTADILQAQHFLGIIDFIHAKADFALQINAICPQIDNDCQIEWNKAVHPLLFLSLKKQNKSVVPLNIILNEKQRILLISGPNAGGKSVCLKTVALLQYMLQCGLPISIHSSSRCGVFEQIFIDIGDEQSIENDLSTYSSHLLNMKFFVRNSNHKTILLIDEFGTGTEPQIGGALAEATLERLNANRTFGVITTHYSNLKHYAQDAEGITNAAMLYDRQQLQPLFCLEIGKPGSSFAIDIARKIGLPDDLIQSAIDKVGAEHIDYDKHLQDIVRDKRYWENKRQQIRQKEKMLDERIEKFETKASDLDRQKKEILEKSKTQALNIINSANVQIEKTIKEIKEAQAEKTKTREIRAELSNLKDTLQTNEINRSNSTPNALPKTKKTKENAKPDNHDQIITGSNVKLKGHESIGKILEIKDNTALVAFGTLQSFVKLERLEKTDNNINRNATRKTASVNHINKTTTDDIRQHKLAFKTEIDIRGMRGDEALQAVTYFIDDAIMVGISSVRILHGTGSGILRQIVRQYLKTVGGIKSFHDEHIQFGGVGITIVEFE